MNVNEDAKALVAKMTIEEVVSQLKFNADAIDRLNIPEYNWWNEALHGVARAGVATVFPQAIGLAAMFNDELLEKIGDCISTEARAKNNQYTKVGDRDIYKGLTFWSPNVNLFRDPRWGRGHETYGEDPFLTSKLGVAFIKGLQGKENYPECDTLKVAACAKHFAAHSGPEGERHHFNAITTPKDMEESYLPQFEAAVKLGKVEAVMGAYNRTNGEPCCASKTLVKETLWEKWGFKGHFVSDCWAIKDIHDNHHVTNKPSESAALALNNGCDLNCGITYLCLLAALKEGLVTEEKLREACEHVMRTRLKLGTLPRSDAKADEKTDDYKQIPFLVNDCDEHAALALKASEESIVLLKNNGVLPLKNDNGVIGVVGPTADKISVLEGNYCGTSSRYVTNLEGIRAKYAGRVLYSEGSHLYLDKPDPCSREHHRLSEAETVTLNSDLVILCIGLDATIEGEEGDAGNSFAAGDKNTLYLPNCQELLCRRVIETAKADGKKVIAVLNAGSAMDISYLDENADAVLQCWYSGELGGQALANVLFGDVNPSGRLPVTFYKEGQVPEFTDYSMKNRTYRYFKGEPLYPFGYGLSYTDFEYSNVSVKVSNECFGEYDFMDYQKPAVKLEVTVKNVGDYDGTDKVLVYVDKMPCEKEYVSGLYDPSNQPVKSLCGFKAVSLKKGECATLSFDISAYSLTTVLEDGSRVLLSGTYEFLVGDKSEKVSI